MQRSAIHQFVWAALMGEAIGLSMGRSGVGYSKNRGFSVGYPLVNIQKTMERSTIFLG